MGMLAGAAGCLGSPVCPSHHPLPCTCPLPSPNAGEEVTQSYFPLPWRLRERRARCRGEYGFECTCPRCQEESTWSGEEGSGSEWESEDEGMGDDAAAGAAAAAAGVAALATGGGSADAMQEAAPADGQAFEAAGAAAAAEQPQADAAYIHIFLLKYVCPRGACRGTMAPLSPQQPDVLECSLCGGRRTEAEFLAELEAAE